MVTDQETDFLFLSGRLKARTTFCHQLITILKVNNVAFQFLPRTKDIWCVDYMPIQVSKDRYIQFRYDPDYLRGPKWMSTKTASDDVTKAIGINTIHSDIVLDGGNVIKGKDWAILTDKIFLENPSYHRTALLDELERLLQVRPT